jgi:hypothetical protein
MQPPLQLAAAALAAALGLAACANPGTSQRLERLYARSLAEPGDVGAALDLARLEEQRQEAAAEARRLHAEGKLASDRDRLIAATLLLDSPELADLELARDLALDVAQRGDDRGFPLAAEAIDRSLYLQGLPQRYGTQYAHVPGYGWVLYRWDERTTDAERTGMGVPTLAEALERLKRLNAK